MLATKTLALQSCLAKSLQLTVSRPLAAPVRKCFYRRLHHSPITQLPRKAPYRNPRRSQSEPEETPEAELPKATPALKASSPGLESLSTPKFVFDPLKNQATIDGQVLNTGSTTQQPEQLKHAASSSASGQKAPGPEINSEPPLNDSEYFSLENRGGSEVVQKNIKEPSDSPKVEVESTAPDSIKTEQPSKLNELYTFKDLSSIKDLPSEQDLRKVKLFKCVSQGLEQLQAQLYAAGQTLNDVTGYSAIGALKKSIEDQDKLLKQYRVDVRKCKEAYTSAINRRSASQREVNELLQRKHIWSTTDLERFTELYRNDHANQQSEAAAERALAAAERASEESQAKLSTLISARYHEEQIWSDKIRRASTWGTFGLMGFNICLFIVVQLYIEPKKRARMVNSFEQVMKQTIENEKTSYKEELQAATDTVLNKTATLKNSLVPESESESEASITLGAAVAAAVSNAAEDQVGDGTEAATFTDDDRKRLARIEELAETEYQFLQQFTSIFPDIKEPAEVYSDVESPYSPYAGQADVSTLTWRNLPHRLLGEKSYINAKNLKETNIDLPETLVVKPVEIASAAGAGAAVGILFGVLCTLIAKG